MPQFRISYRPAAATADEVVEADTCEVEDATGWLLLRRTVLVIGRPRDIVVRRIRAGDVTSVDEIDPHRAS